MAMALQLPTTVSDFGLLAQVALPDYLEQWGLSFLCLWIHNYFWAVVQMPVLQLSLL